MKYLSCAILVFAVLSACNNKNNTGLPPVIGLVSDSGYIANDTILSLGDVYTIGVNAYGEDFNLTNFIIEVASNEIEVFLDSGMNTRKMNYKRTLVKGPSEWEKWTYIIRDRNGQSSHVSQRIILDTSSIVYGNIITYENIELGAQNSTINGFLSLANGSTYNMESAFNNQNIIDMCYYYDNVDTDENTISSPGGNISDLIYPGDFWPGNWEIRNTTRFKSADISIDEFNSATNDSLLIVSYGTSDGKRKAKNLKTGNIFSFKNEDGKIGLFVVNSIEGQESGVVNISIKVQE